MFSKVLALAALLAFAGCSGAVPPTPTPTMPPLLWVAGTAFGTQTHQYDLFKHGEQTPDTAELDAIHAAGFSVVRFTVNPEAYLQNGQGVWDLSPLSAFYADALARQIIPLFTLGSKTLPGPAVDEMTAFIKQAAPLYPDAVIELGNEPDQWGITAAQYWAEVQPWAQAWAAANPAAPIGTGGTSGIDLAWQKGLLDAGAFSPGTPLTALAIHPYGLCPYTGAYCTQPGVSGDDLYANLSALKAMLPADTLVWLTEISENNPDGAFVSDWLDAVRAIQPSLFVYYDIRDSCQYGACPPQGNGTLQTTGLLNANMTHKNPDVYYTAQSILNPPATPTPTASP